MFKHRIIIFMGVLLAAFVISQAVGQGNAQAAAKGKAKLQLIQERKAKRVTYAQRKAAAERARALGMVPATITGAAKGGAK